MYNNNHTHQLICETAGDPKISLTAFDIIMQNIFFSFLDTSKSNFYKRCVEKFFICLIVSDY